MRFHATDHVEHAVEGWPVLHLAPRGAHAEPRGPRGTRPRCSVEDVIDGKHLLAQNGRLVVTRLRTVRAVFRAAAGLHAEQRAELNGAGRMVGQVNGPGAV